jgi:hypothetical protein
MYERSHRHAPGRARGKRSSFKLLKCIASSEPMEQPAVLSCGIGRSSFEPARVPQHGFQKTISTA